ncbi:MAG: prepilin-type N-terminal cleavage/methylation domain-containing protein [Candidatus Omnitrophota bacterium]|nr:prepilin-type N-terminal cleavage/methylation domain-containing protein [Candidatus Omnitrophota bacterium]
MWLNKKLNKKGFTLLELMIVVIIIGVLAAIAIPRYIDTITRARGAEAFTQMDTIRMSLTRYWSDQLARFGIGTYVGANLADGVLGSLDIEDPNANVERYFEYTLPALGVATYTIQAQRYDAKVTDGGNLIANAIADIDETGDISYGAGW